MNHIEQLTQGMTPREVALVQDVAEQAEQLSVSELEFIISNIRNGEPFNQSSHPNHRAIVVANVVVMRKQMELSGLNPDTPAGARGTFDSGKPGVTGEWGAEARDAYIKMAERAEAGGDMELAAQLRQSVVNTDVSNASSDARLNEAANIAARARIGWLGMRCRSNSVKISSGKRRRSWSLWMRGGRIKMRRRWSVAEICSIF